MMADEFMDAFNARRRIEGRREVWCLLLADRQAECFLRAVEPYSVVKAQQVGLALEFRTLGQRKPFEKVPQEHYDNCARIAAAIRACNGMSYRTPKAVPSDYVVV